MNENLKQSGPELANWIKKYLEEKNPLNIGPKPPKSLKIEVDRFDSVIIQLVEQVLAQEPLDKGLSAITWMISEGQEPNVFFRKLKKEAREIVCSQVWNDGYYFYRCRDCGETPSSSICAQCFTAGNHTGHDWVFEVSVFGGCCDCGNSSSWKPSGNCSRHTGKFSEDPCADFPQNTVSILSSVIRGVMITLEKFIRKDESEMILKITQFLRFLVSQHEVYMYVLNREMMAAPPDKCLATTILHATLSLEGSILTEVLLLFLDLLQEPAFKAEFLPIYVKHYPALTAAILDSPTQQETLYKLSPQLFSLPAVSAPLCLVEGGGLVKQMIDNLVWIFGHVLLPDSKPPKLDPSTQFIQKHNYFAFTNDYASLFISPEVSRHIILNCLNCMEPLLIILNFMQFMNPETRKIDQHVEYESEGWKGAFSIEAEMFRNSDLFRKGIVSIKDTPSLQENLPKLEKFLALIMDSFHRWYLSWSPATPIATYDVSTQPVSFHIPLNRFYATILLETLKLYPEQPLSRFLGGKELLMADHPIQLQVAVSQIQAGLWIRNGISAALQASIYKNNYFLGMHQMDMFLIQVALCLDPVRTFDLIFDRYGIHPDQPSFSKNLDDMLRLLIHLISLRAGIGIESEESRMERDLIHALAVEPRTHSKLLEELSVGNTEPKYMEVLLKRIANQQKSSSQSPTKYYLKEEYWKLFDPFYPYEIQSLQKAMEAYANHKPKRVILPVLAPTLPQFAGLFDCLHVAGLLKMCLSLLEIALKQPDPSHVSVLRSILHLILLNLEHPERNLISKTSDPIENSVSLLIDLYQHSAMTEHKDYLQPILEKLCERPRLQKTILTALPNLILEPQTSVNPQFEEKQKRAKQRQQEIMMKMKKQQAQFLTSQKEDKLTDPVVDDFETISQGQLCAYCRSQTGDSIWMAIAQVTPTLVPKLSLDNSEYFVPDSQENLSMMPQSTFLSRFSSEEDETLTVLTQLELEDENRAQPLPANAPHPSFFNTNSSLGYNVLSCGHFLHIDCAEKFIESTKLQYAYSTLYNIRTATNPFVKEFPCPVCRRISNTLLPIPHPSHEVPEPRIPSSPKPSSYENHSDLDNEMLQFVSSLTNPDILLSKQEISKENSKITSQELFGALQLLCKRLAPGILLSSLSEQFPWLCNGLISSLTSFEIALREPSFLPFPEFDCLRPIAQTLKLVASQCPDPEGVRMLVSSIVGVKNDSAPFLSLDMFDFFVRMSLLLGPFSPQAKSFLVIASLGALTQTILKTYGEASLPISVHDPFLPFVRHILTSRNISSLQIVEDSQPSVIPKLIPFFRRVFLFQILMSMASLPAIPSSCDAFVHHFALPSFPQLADPANKCFFRLVNIWCVNLGTFALPPLLSLRTPSLVPLPATFQDLVMRYVFRTCSHCSKPPPLAAICLFCAKLFCVGNTECYTHSLSCAGLFLLLKSTAVLILKPPFRSLGFGSLYLDSHGEEDLNLRRGKVLHLQPHLYQKLTKHWLAGTLFTLSSVIDSAQRDAKHL